VWGSRCSRVEHRLFGVVSCIARKYTWSSWPGWNVVVWGPAPDTLLGPEGSGVKLDLQAGIRSGPSPLVNRFAAPCLLGGVG
jgi:hypothetical protein